MRADASDVYPMGMMGFLVWDVNSTDIGKSLVIIHTWIPNK